MAEEFDIFLIVYLDDIFIYIEDPGQAYVDAVLLVFKKLRKNGFFAKVKKCRFDKDEVCLLGYVISAQRIRMEEKRIDTVKNWPKPKSILDIQIFLGFANFYCCFIQSFGKIAAPLTLMLKISLISTMPKLMNLVDKFGKGDCDENEARRAFTLTKGPTRADYPSSNHISHTVSNIDSNFAKNFSDYLTPDAKKAFDQLRQAFTKALIL